MRARGREEAAEATTSNRDALVGAGLDSNQGAEGERSKRGDSRAPDHGREGSSSACSAAPFASSSGVVGVCSHARGSAAPRSRAGRLRLTETVYKRILASSILDTRVPY